MEEAASNTWQIVLYVWLAFEWAIRLIMLYIVPRRGRTLASANGWLLLVMLLPSIGSILFFMFADPKLPAIRRKRQGEVDKLTAKELDEIQALNEVFAEPETESGKSLSNLATKLGGLPPMAGNSITFLTNYKESLRVIADEINRAQRYTHLEYFIITKDEATQPVFTALAAARARGVKVRVLLDKIVSRNYPGHKEMLAFFKEQGVEVKYMIPLSLLPGKNFTRPDLRNHRKIIVVDGETAFTGSQNIIRDSYHRKDELRYEELSAKIVGPAVWQLNNVFRADWYQETQDPLLELVEDESLPKAAGESLLQVLPSGPSHKEENNLRFYTSMIYAAKERIGIVVPYFIPDDAFLDALTTAAQRGVEVTLINSEIIDKTLAGHAQRSFYEELLASGVRIYHYKKPAFLHNKQLIIDDRIAVIGSSNLDVRSFALDLELNVIIYGSKDVQELAKIEQDYLKKSRKITLKQWSERSFSQKVLESIARVTAPFL